MNPSITVKVGRTCLRVMRKTVNEQTRKETVDKIHEGIVIENCGSFVRIYSPAPLDKGGDVSPETAQLFPLAGDLLWCEFVAERATPFPIPPLFR